MQSYMRWLFAMLVAVAVILSAPLDAAAQKEDGAPQYPEYWRANFMTGCTEGNADPTICICVLRGFEFSWPFWVAEEFDRASSLPAEQRTLQQAELLEAGNRIAVACVNNTNAY